MRRNVLALHIFYSVQCSNAKHFAACSLRMLRDKNLRHNLQSRYKNKRDSADTMYTSTVEL